MIVNYKPGEKYLNPMQTVNTLLVESHLSTCPGIGENR